MEMVQITITEYAKVILLNILDLILLIALKLGILSPTYCNILKMKAQPMEETNYSFYKYQ